MNLSRQLSRLASRRLALRCLLLCAGLAAALTGCDNDDDSGSKAGAVSACESKSYCYEVVGGLSSDDQQICAALGSQVLAACDPSKAVRKCTQVTKVSTNGGPEKDVTYVYYFREGDTTSCLGTEEKLN